MKASKARDEGLKQICLNEKAPDFKAKSTQGAFRLSDLKGQWVVLFAHPADCAPEFIEFVRLADAFRKCNAQPVCLLVGRVRSPRKWVRKKKKHIGAPVTFTVIPHPHADVECQYGFGHPETSVLRTARGAIVLDEKRIVRGMVYYPLATGHHVEDLLRLVQALQAHATS